jgi:tetratricopeptide (TPR) repeat protein
VDYIITKKEDGSVSCTIGVLDLLTLTNWRMEINLPKDKAFFTTQSFWYNSTPTEQPYYHWMNVGLKVSGNLEYIYPGNKYIGHEGEYNDWPINKDNGKNISFYNNNNFGTYKSYHVFGKYTNFFGTYWHDDDYGMVRYSNHDDKAGKKIWIWGLSRQGMIWEKYLTDTDQQYTEVQSGKLFNQNAEKSTFTPFKHVNFSPYSTDTWKEYWYAVNKTKGMVEASVYGALNMVQNNGWLKIMFCPVQQINDAIEIKVGNKIIYSKQVSLAPTINFVDSVKYNPAQGDYAVSIGGVKLNYSSASSSNVLSRPVESPSNFDWNNANGFYIKGKEFMDQKLYDQAEAALATSLKMDSNYLPALVKMSSLQYRNHNYNSALVLVKKALSIDTHDGSANYYYGIINAALGNTVDAKDGFDLATLSAEYKTGAYTELAKLYLAEKNYSNVIDYTNKALTYNAINIAALQLQAIAFRYTNDQINYDKTIKIIKSYDPLNHFVNFDAYYKLRHSAAYDEQKINQALRSFNNLIQNEQPFETYLQIANDYYNVGLLNEAEQVLAICPANTLVKYWLAYIHAKQNKTFKTDLDAANSAAPDFVFPFRNLDFDVFEWATKQSSHWKPKYYLALLLKDRNKVAQSKAIFTSLQGEPDYAPFFIYDRNYTV